MPREESIYTDVQSFMPYAVSTVKRHIVEENIDGLQAFMNDLSELSSNIDSFLGEIPEYLNYYQEMQEKLRREEEANIAHMRKKQEIQERMEKLFGVKENDGPNVNDFFNTGLDFSAPSEDDDRMNAIIEDTSIEEQSYTPAWPVQQPQPQQTPPPPAPAPEPQQEPYQTPAPSTSDTDIDIAVDEFSPTMPSSNTPGAFSLTNDFGDSISEALREGAEMAAVADKAPDSHAQADEKPVQETPQQEPDTTGTAEQEADASMSSGIQEISSELSLGNITIEPPKYDDYPDEFAAAVSDEDDDEDDDGDGRVEYGDDDEDNIDALLSDDLFA